MSFTSLRSEWSGPVYNKLRILRGHLCAFVAPDTSAVWLGCCLSKGILHEGSHWGQELRFMVHMVLSSETSLLWAKRTVFWILFKHYYWNAAYQNFWSKQWKYNSLEEVWCKTELSFFVTVPSFLSTCEIAQRYKTLNNLVEVEYLIAENRTINPTRCTSVTIVTFLLRQLIKCM